MNETAFRLLTAMRERLQHHPMYVAHSFHLYQQHSGLADRELAEELDTNPQQLLRLALCKCPDAASPAFARQVKELAAYAEVDARRLARLLKEAQRLQHPAQPARPWQAVALASLRRFVAAVPQPVLPLLTSVLILGVVYGGYQFVIREQATPPGLTKLPTHRDAPTPDPVTSQVAETAPPPSSVAATDKRLPQSSGNIAKVKPLNQRAPQEVIAIASIKVDLTDHQTLREAQISEVPRKTIRLPQARTRVSFTLPEGSPQGSYTVLIVDAFDKPLVSRKARSLDGKTLTVVLDASALEEKTYRLCIFHRGEAPGYYQVIVEKEKNPRK